MTCNVPWAGGKMICGLECGSRAFFFTRCISDHFEQTPFSSCVHAGSDFDRVPLVSVKGSSMNRWPGRSWPSTARRCLGWKRLPYVVVVVFHVRQRVCDARLLAWASTCVLSPLGCFCCAALKVLVRLQQSTVPCFSVTVSKSAPDRLPSQLATQSTPVLVSPGAAGVGFCRFVGVAGNLFEQPLGCASSDAAEPSLWRFVCRRTRRNRNLQQGARLAAVMHDSHAVKECPRRPALKH